MTKQEYRSFFGAELEERKKMEGLMMENKRRNSAFHNKSDKSTFQLKFSLLDHATQTNR